MIIYFCENRKMKAIFAKFSQEGVISGHPPPDKQASNIHYSSRQGQGTGQ
jgi:hypothetical protein